MKQMNIKQFIYWLRIHGFRPEQFGAGSKKNPIRLKEYKCYDENNKSVTT